MCFKDGRRLFFISRDCLSSIFFRRKMRSVGRHKAQTRRRKKNSKFTTDDFTRNCISKQSLKCFAVQREGQKVKSVIPKKSNEMRNSSAWNVSRTEERTHTFTHTLTLTRTRTHTHSHTHSHAHARTHAHTHIHTHTHTHTHARTHAHTHIHTHTHTHTHARTHTHTHTHRRPRSVAKICGVFVFPQNPPRTWGEMCGPDCWGSRQWQ